MTTRECAFSAPPMGLSRGTQRMLRLLTHLKVGRLELSLPDGSHHVFGHDDGLRASVSVHDAEVFDAVLRSGDIGFAEAYIEGRWSSPDVPALLRLMLANRDRLEAAIDGSWWGRLWYVVRHALNRNSRAGSRRNIHAHYDLGNAFYERWLDPSMNYSSAWFQGDLAKDLQAAQQAKVQRALDEANVQPGDRVLEIGCGWGAVAEAVVAERGAHITGITLSSEQLDFAQRRLARQGLAAQADLRLQDYREIDDAPFDAIISIEMVEAVGQAWWPTYFDRLMQSLKPGGRACVQSIVIRDDRFERYARGTDFIQQYIFPGGMLPSDERFCAAAALAGLQVERKLAFGADYAETLRRWRMAFLSQEVDVRQQGFDARFCRTWDFYLAYCEAAFDSGNTDVIQYTLTRPRSAI